MLRDCLQVFCLPVGSHMVRSSWKFKTLLKLHIWRLWILLSNSLLTALTIAYFVIFFSFLIRNLHKVPTFSFYRFNFHISSCFEMLNNYRKQLLSSSQTENQQAHTFSWQLVGPIVFSHPLNHIALARYLLEYVKIIEN